jgi:hypothetical protein
LMRDPSELISAYFDDSLAEGELAELRSWLARDPDSLRQFVRESVIHSRLRDVLQQYDVRGLVLDDAVDPQNIATLLDEEEAAALRREQELAEAARREALAAARAHELLDRKSLRIEEARTSRLAIYASFAAAAALLFMLGRWLGPAPEPTAGVAAHRPAGPPVVAEVAGTFDARLVRGKRRLAPGEKLSPGAVALDRGVAELQLASGARLLVEGPAEVELVSAQRARLVRGRVVAQVPEQALGFTLQSGAASFVDLGTEFGVEAADGGEARIHVLDGEVALVSDKKEAAPSRTLQRGAASEVASDGSVREIPFDESRFLRRVPVSAYELAVLKSRPLAYWRLDAVQGNAEIRSSGRLALASLVGAGIASADNRGSAAGPARAAVFAGEHEGVAVAGDAALGLVSNCTCEAWVLPGEAPSGPQRIFSTFDRPRSGLAIGVVDGRWYNLADDELKFHLTVYGVYDCISATPIARNRWVHLAATIGADGAPALYINGEAVERRFRPLPEGDAAPPPAGPANWSAERPTPVGKTTAGEARLGRNPWGADGQVSPERWTGRISDVAVYDRVLGVQEIREHFQATKSRETKQLSRQP